MGHPDKVADQISDSILDHCLAADPTSRVACETMVTTDLAIVSGEITTKADLSRETVDKIIRNMVREIGYTDPAIGFAAKTMQVHINLHAQSPDISMGVTAGAGLHNEEQGAGDQGMMFGYACDETAEFMPATIMYSHKLLQQLSQDRRKGVVNFLRPDAKSQVTAEYKNGKVTIWAATQNPQSVQETVAPG